MSEDRIAPDNSQQTAADKNDNGRERRIAHASHTAAADLVDVAHPEEGYSVEHSDFGVMQDFGISCVDAKNFSFPDSADETG